MLKKHISLRSALPIIILTSFLMHLSYLPNGFVWLDHNDIEARGAILPLSKLSAAFFMPFGTTGFYRPMVTIIHSLDAFFYGQFAQGYHFTNVLLHLMVTTLVPFFLITFISLTPLEILLAGLIFGLHPLSFLPVGVISYRPELLLALFTFLSVIFHAKARKTGRVTFYVLTWFCFIAALFSKETALVIVPGLIGLWELSKGLQLKVKTRRNVWILYVGEILLIIVYFSLRLMSVPDVWHLKHTPLSFSQMIGTRLSVFGTYIFWLIFPMLPHVSDATEKAAIFSITSLAGGLCLGGILIILFRNRIRSDLRIALFMLLLLVLPGLNILALPRFRSPHYVYLAVASLSFLAILLKRMLERKLQKSKPILFILFIVWTSVAGIATFLGGFRMQNDQTIFAPEVAADSYYPEAHFYLGNFYWQRKNISQAEKEYQAALIYNPVVIAYAEPHAVLTNLAGIRLQQNRFDEAEKLLEKAAKIAPSSLRVSIAYDRALIATKRGNYEKTVTILAPLADRFTKLEYYLLLANAYHYLNQKKEGSALLQQSLSRLTMDNSTREKIEMLIKTE